MPITIGTLSVFRELEEALAANGWSLHRSFDALRGLDDVTVLWDLASFSSLPREVRAKAEGRIIGFCLESPLIAHRSYHHLASVAKKATHLFLYPGALDLVPADLAQRHPIFWPNDSSRNMVRNGDDPRSFLVMIASNKRTHRGWEPMQLGTPFRSARMMASRVVAWSYKGRGKWTVPNLYTFRLEAIRHFADNPRFDLYGMGWDEPIPRERHYRKQITSCYRGPAEDKDSLMRLYRFALCFENTIFPGYITEKIFDCFYAGTIPVYLGAPDVDRYIPSACFIDARKFESFRVLEDYLLSLDEVEIRAYRQRIWEFLHSDRFTPFKSSTFVDALLTAIEDVNTPPGRSSETWG